MKITALDSAIATQGFAVRHAATPSSSGLSAGRTTLNGASGAVGEELPARLDVVRRRAGRWCGCEGFNPGVARVDLRTRETRLNRPGKSGDFMV